MSRRTEAQNNLMWSRLTDLANQVEWTVNGKAQLISPNDWKEITTAGLRKEQRIASGIDGGFVVLGACPHVAHECFRRSKRSAGLH